MVLGLLFLSGCYDKRYSDIKKVKKGMNVYQVIKIMGRPDTIIIKNPHVPVDSLFEYNWNAPILASSNFEVHFSKKDSTVKYIVEGN
jgi:hypothetical protein